MNVIKRNGQEVEFDRRKIQTAIEKANEEAKAVNTKEVLNDEDISAMAARLYDRCRKRTRAVSVEEIQDMIETELMRCGAYETAKRFVRYRYWRAQVRHKNTTDDQILALIENSNEEVKQENSNKNPTVTSVQRDYMAGEVSKDLTRRVLLPPDIVKAHDEGIIHFHDTDYFAGHSHNCFSGGTRFITSDGIRQFKDFKDGASVYVKDMNGDIRLATVHNYGKQKMQKVYLKNNRMEHEVICTPDHRWILQDGTVTTSLSVGDKLFLLKDSTEAKIDTYDDAIAFCTGFVVGDGVDVKGTSVRVRLCGEKTKYRDAFELAGYTIHAIKDSDDLEASKRNAIKQDFLNGKCWRHMSSNGKALAFKGLYAADGSKNASRICTADDRVCLFIEETSGLAGYYITSKNEVIHDTNYKKGARLVCYQMTTSTPANWAWTVSKIERTRDGAVDAWCVEEPVTHSFTLEKGIVTGNCDLINLEDMLQNGTVISGTMIEKPHSFSTACNIATQIIAQVASSQYGGQSISLTHLAPFVDVSRQKIKREVREEQLFAAHALGKNPTNEELNEIADKITERRVRDEIRRGVQTIQYQVVTLMTTNGQAPFITVFMYLGEARNEQEKKDLALIIEEVLDQRIQGVKNEAGAWITPAFPKLVYVLEEQNIHEDSPYFYLTKLAAKCTAKRMVPDYISEKIMKQLKHSAYGTDDCYTCMGCRSFLTPDRVTIKYGNISKAKNYEEGKPKYYGRFNQGVVTLNLVDIALSSKKDLDNFWSIFDERAELCHRALRCRHERLKGTKSDVAPILWQYGALARLDKGETIDKLLYGGYSTISLGYAGLWECVYYMTGKKLTEPEGEAFGLEVMKKLNEYTAKWKAAEDIDYSLYGTPLETTTYKFAKCLQRRFGTIEGVTDKNYITNSYHVHVTENISAFDKLALEAKFQALSPGGAISYVEVPNMQHNIDAVLSIMKFIYDNIMYAELNTKSDYCQVCGYDGEIQIKENEDGKLIWECPSCGNRDQSKLNVARRTCGYIGTQFWNQGRTQEIKERVMHVD